MNKAVTDGLVFMPPAFSNDLSIWSSENGVTGSNTYASDYNAAFVPADQDFGGCLELLKTQATTKLRYMGQTPFLAGCYLRVTAKVKAISGNFPDVRIGAWPGGAGNQGVAGQVQFGPATTLTTYGEVVTISAIIGTGARPGVDMVWSGDVTYAHVGVDLTGSNGGIVRIDDIQVEDLTSAFLRDMIDWVDVRDYGALGDGTTDDHAAFEAADAASNGRSVLVPAGTYYLGDHVTINAPIRFQGTVTMPANKRLELTKSFDLPTYADAFGSELEGFRKGIQALFNFSDHEAFDMKGRKVDIDAPIDVQAAVENKTSFANRRVIRNGQINCLSSANWDTDVVTSSASYSTSNARVLSNVTNIASIAVGSHIWANVGVGREVYVKAVDVGRKEITLSQPLYGAPSSQTYTFSRFKYALDFSGFTNLQRFVLSDIEFLLADRASGVLLPTGGLTFHIKESFFTGPKDRAITSHGTGCQGLNLDRNQFLSSEQSKPVSERHTIAFNSNKNDVKLRDNRAVRFLHFGVMSGTGHLILGNHFFQGDAVQQGPRSAGLVITEPNMKTIISGNYIDNCSIEWTNEYDSAPGFQSEYSFGGLSIVGNIFMSSRVASWFRWISIKPYGPGHYLNGFNMTGNTFKQISGPAVARVDNVDTTFAELDRSRFADVNIAGNTYHGVSREIRNPLTVPVTINSPSSVWEEDLSDHLPFGGMARIVTAISPEGAIRNGSNVAVYDLPYTTGKKGASGQSIRLHWPQAVKGKVFVTARVDAAL